MEGLIDIYWIGFVVVFFVTALGATNDSRSSAREKLFTCFFASLLWPIALVLACIYGFYKFIVDLWNNN